ncbi:MAG: flagellar hook-length control protein FliK [Dehalococcoidia bacterium]
MAATQTVFAASNRSSAPAPPVAIHVAAAAESAGAVPPGRTIDQVAATLTVAVADGRSEATLVLRPAALGEVRVRIGGGPEGLVVRIAAEREAVAELLGSGLDHLRDALAGQGVAVAELHVLPTSLPPAAPAETPVWQEPNWTRRRRLVAPARPAGGR